MLLLCAALGAGALLTASTDALVAANDRDAREVLYAADAALGRAMADLAAWPDWTAALSGAVRSTFVDGPPAGNRTLPDGSILDLGTLASLADCGHADGCSDAQLDAVTADRPWGANNPRWQLWGYGPVARLAFAAPGDRACYLVMLVADDPSETDGDPLRDAAGPDEPGAGIILVRVEAFGVRGLRQTLEATVARVTDESRRPNDDSDGGPAPAVPPALEGDRISFLRLLSWRWIR